MVLNILGCFFCKSLFSGISASFLHATNGNYNATIADCCVTIGVFNATIGDFIATIAVFIVIIGNCCATFANCSEIIGDFSATNANYSRAKGSYLQKKAACSSLRLCRDVWFADFARWLAPQLLPHVGRLPAWAELCALVRVDSVFCSFSPVAGPTFPFFR